MGSKTCVYLFTELLSPPDLWPAIASIKGNVTLDLFHARLRELVCGFPGSTLTGLVSVQNSVFLSTRSVSARRGDLE